MKQFELVRFFLFIAKFRLNCIKRHGGDNSGLWPRKGGSERLKLMILHILANVLGFIFKETIHFDDFAYL